MSLLGSLAYLLVSVVFYMITTQRLPSDAACLKVISPFSLGEEAIEYELRNFHEEFASKLLYRGPPTVERESRWDSLTPFGLLPLTEEGLATSSGRAGGVEKQQNAGENNDKFYVVPGFVKNMNCLKTLRRYIYQDINQTLFTQPTRQEADNCIEVLREELMCNLDATPYLIVDDPRASRGKAPFMGNTHYCRNYEQLTHWAILNFISEEEISYSSVLIDI